MKLPTFDSQSEIPQGFESLYEEKDGKWSPIEFETADEIAGLKKSLEAARSERDGEKKGKGVLEAKIADLESKVAEAERKRDAEAAGVTSEKVKELETKIRADVQREFESRLKEKDQEIESLTGIREENTSLKLDQRVKAQMAEAGVLGNRIDHLFALKRDLFQLSDDGKPMIKEHPSRDIKVFFEDEIKKEFPEWFQGSKGNGGGASGFSSNGSPVGGTTADDVLKNPAAAMDAARHTK